MTKKSKLLVLGGAALVAVLSFVLYSSTSTESLQGNMFQKASELSTSRISSRVLPVVNNSDLSVSVRSLRNDKDGDVQTFTINYAVQAVASDVFIDGAPDNLADLPSRNRGSAYVVDSDDVYTASGSTSSSASVVNGYYRVRRGSTVNFTTYIEVNIASTDYLAGLERLGYTTSAKVVRAAGEPDKSIRGLYRFTRQQFVAPAEVELISQNVTKTTLEGRSDIANYTYEFSVTAPDQDIYLSQDTTDADAVVGSNELNLHYSVSANPTSAALAEPIAELTSSARATDGVFVVEAGDTENFEVQIQASTISQNAIVMGALNTLVYSNEEGRSFRHDFGMGTRQTIALVGRESTELVDEDVEDTYPIEISFVSQEVTKTAVLDTPDTGIYTFVFDVTAATDTYISRDLQALSGLSAPVGASLFASTNATNDGNPNGTITSSADLEGGLYFVEAGQTERFTATVSVTPTATGFFEISLHRLAFKLNSPEGPFSSELFPSLVNFRQTTQLTFRGA